jgi:methionyl-tRNA formyltransferase
MNSLKELKVAFFGTPEFSLEFLKYLKLNKITISFIVTQSASQSGRGKRISRSPVEDWGIKNKIQTFSPFKINDENFRNKIKDMKVDFIVVVAYGNLIDEFLINFPKFLTINVHASLLPKWRGAAPIQRSILNGDEETGVCIMKIVKKLDAGPIIQKKKIKINMHDNSATIYKKMLDLGKPLLIKSLEKIIKNDFKFIQQDESLVSYAKKIEKKESRIDWTESAKLINRKIRAFNPFPGAFTTFKDSGRRIKILKAEVVPDNMVKLKEKMKVGFFTNDLTVKCGKGYLRILELQPEGKKALESNEFLNGYKTTEFLFG